MECRRMALGCWTLTCFLAVVSAVSGQAMTEEAPAGRTPPAPAFITPPVALDEVPPAVRERVRLVMEHPTLASRGPLEAFHCRPPLYFWLLDHPDLAVRLWRGIGAKCTDIYAAGEGRFSWLDGQNGEIHWDTVLRTARQRVWYAEGKVRPSVMLPAVTVSAVVVLNHQEGSDGNGRPAIRHQMDLYLHTDSHAVKMAARLFGASAPRIAEEYVGQMEMFFGGLAWYLTQHPEKAALLFEELKRPVSGTAPRGAITPPDQPAPRSQG
jgi:hypothetical protein